MASFLKDKFFPIVRSGLDIDNKPVSLTESELKLMQKIAKRQSIEPVIWRGLKKNDIKESLIKELSQEKNKCMFFYVNREDSLSRISSALECAKIEYIPLKGVRLCELYPENWMRTCGDIDILVHEEEIDRAVEIIEKKTDFKAVQKNYHDISMLNNIMQLELHFNIKENIEGIDSLLDKVWSYANQDNGSKRYSLTPEFQIFSVLAHMSYHMSNGGLGIRPFIDLWLLRKKTEYDEGIVRRMCESCKILKFYDVCCDMVKVWFEDCSHTGITEELERFCLMGGAYGTDEGIIKSHQREYSGVSYIFKRIFVNKTFLQKRYPKLESRPYLFPYYQVCRWFSLLETKRNRAIRKEVSIVKNTSRDEVASIDKFLTKLGL